MQRSRIATIALGVAFAADAVADDCSRVRANIETTITTESCTSPVGMCAVGEVTKSRLIGGTTFFTGLGLGGGAVGEESVVTPAAEAGSTMTYAGKFVITTDAGTLTLKDVGVYDTAGRPFAEFQRIIGGTGQFENATGVLFSYGMAREDGTGFRGRLRGTICWPD